MQLTSSVPVFSALGQNTRMRAFDLLLREGERGMLQGEIARSLGVEKNLLSVHLRILEAAGLVTAERHGRTKTFRVAASPAQEAASGLLAMISGRARVGGGRPPLQGTDSAIEADTCPCDPVTVRTDRPRRQPGG